MPALYMPAIVAMRLTPNVRAKYDHLKAADKASKLAITAVIRNHIVLANALLRGRPKMAAKIGLTNTDTLAAQRPGEGGEARGRIVLHLPAFVDERRRIDDL